jgi:hypothetical protein
MADGADIGFVPDGGAAVAPPPPGADLGFVPDVPPLQPGADLGFIPDPQPGADLGFIPDQPTQPLAMSKGLLADYGSPAPAGMDQGPYSGYSGPWAPGWQQHWEEARQTMLSPQNIIRNVAGLGVEAARTVRDVLSPETYLPPDQRETPFVIKGGEMRPMTDQEQQDRDWLHNGTPLYQTTRNVVNPEGSDLGRLGERWSTPEGILSAPIAATPGGGAAMLASMLPQLAQQTKQIVTGEGTDTEKRDAANDLFAMGMLMAWHPALEEARAQLAPEAVAQEELRGQVEEALRYLQASGKIRPGGIGVGNIVNPESLGTGTEPASVDPAVGGGNEAGPTTAAPAREAAAQAAEKVDDLAAAIKDLQDILRANQVKPSESVPAEPGTDTAEPPRDVAQGGGDDASDDEGRAPDSALDAVRVALARMQLERATEREQAESSEVPTSGVEERASDSGTESESEGGASAEQAQAASERTANPAGESPAQTEAEQENPNGPSADAKTGFEAWLDKAIDATNPFKGSVLEGVTGAPVWISKILAFETLKTVRAALRAGRGISEAIETGIAWLRDRNPGGFDENEARDWLWSQAQSWRRVERVKAELAQAQQALKAALVRQPATSPGDYRQRVALATARYQQLRGERNRLLLSSSEGQRTLQNAMKTNVGDVALSWMAQQSPRRQGESTADWKARLANEFIAQAASGDSLAWRRTVEHVQAWYAARGFGTLTREEASRLILRLLEEQKAEGKTRVVTTSLSDLRRPQGPPARGLGIANAAGSGIQKVNGRNPINYRYAGQTYPASKLPQDIREKYPNGVQFRTTGFPDVSPHAIATVKIKKGLTSEYDHDARLANKKAGLSETPEGYVWHHVEDEITMQLVPRNLHEPLKHTGGSARIRGRTLGPGPG